jgi:hypothetical protein
MEITNEHRDLYKLIKSYDKLNKSVDIKNNQPEYLLALELEKAGFIQKNLEKNWQITDKNLPRKEREKAYKQIYFKNNKLIQFPVSRCEKPKFSGKGITWKKFIHELNNTETIFYLDTSWGNFFYFQAPDDRWYKIPLFLNQEQREQLDIDIEKTLTNEKQKLMLKY